MDKYAAIFMRYHVYAYLLSSPMALRIGGSNPLVHPIFYFRHIEGILEKPLPELNGLFTVNSSEMLNAF
jgi:hypothetical protein